MAFLQVANRAVSKLTADISATDTSFTVTTGDGALFPTGNFVVTIDDERILVGSRSGDTFSSLTRGYDGTTAASHTAGTRVELRIIARHIQELQNFCNTAGQPNGLATLDANGKVVQDPANAGLGDGQICRLPTATQGQVLMRGASSWVAQTPSAVGFNSRVAAYLSTNQSVSANTVTKVAFNTKVFDSNNEYNTTTYRFTAANTGYYLVNALVRASVSTAPNSLLYLYIYKNGSIYSLSEVYFVYTDIVVQVSDIIYLNASDYIEINVYCNSAFTVSSGATNTRLSIHRLS